LWGFSNNTACLFVISERKIIPENIVMCVLFIPTRLQAKSQHISPDIYQQQRRRRKIPLCLVSVWYSQKMERMKMGI
jgi:hypothetical protein